MVKADCVRNVRAHCAALLRISKLEVGLPEQVVKECVRSRSVSQVRQYRSYLRTRACISTCRHGVLQDAQLVSICFRVYSRLDEKARIRSTPRSLEAGTRTASRMLYAHGWGRQRRHRC